MSGLRTAAVVPVRGHARLLDGCLAALRAQEVPLDEVVVVDDTPGPDGDPVLAALDGAGGLRVLRSAGRGPYAARNVGWRASRADVVLFLDARTRPRPDWSHRLAEPFTDPTVALAGSEVLVGPGGGGLGALAAQAQQPYRLRNHLARPFFLPYLPTCNLAVRRSDLDAVGGFDEVRSGGDADLCWQVLSLPAPPQRRLHAVEDVLADWVPREGARAYLEQHHRYGRSHHRLRVDWGLDLPAPRGRALLAKRAAATGLRFALARARRDTPAATTYLQHLAGTAFDVGYRLAVDASSRTTDRTTDRTAPSTTSRRRPGRVPHP